MLAEMRVRYSNSELKELLSSMVMLIDTREQVNQHITSYFRTQGVSFRDKKLDYGDYSAYLPANPKLGIQRHLYLNASIERKNSVDELAQSIKDRTRFENELIRAKGSPFLLMVEDVNGYEKIIRGEYRSQYQPKALLASLKAFEARYGFQTVFVSQQTAGNYIYWHFYYLLRNLLIT